MADVLHGVLMSQRKSEEGLADLLRLIWRVLRGTAAFRFYSMTFWGGVSLIVGAGYWLLAIEWLSVALGERVGLPPFSAESVSTWFAQIIGGVITILSIILFHQTEMNRVKEGKIPAPREGKIRIMVTGDTTFKELAERFATIAKKQLQFETFDQAGLNQLVRKSTYEYESLSIALKGIKASLRNGCVLKYTVIEKDGNFILKGND